MKQRSCEKAEAPATSKPDTVEKAADNLIYHIAPSDASDKNGKIFKEKKEYALTDYWKDSHISSLLWETTEFLLKDKINVGL